MSRSKEKAKVFSETSNEESTLEEQVFSEMNQQLFESDTAPGIQEP